MIKQYSNKNFLNEEEFDKFVLFLKEANISTEELALFDSVSVRAIDYRLTKKRIKRKFSQEFAKSKKEALDKKFSDLTGEKK